MNHATTPLDTATDELNELLRRAETSFQSMCAGVVVTIVLDDDPPAALTFDKAGGTWGLRVLRRTSIGTDRRSGSSTPLLQASRRYRVLAAGKLEELREAILDAQGTKLDDIEAACEQAREFLSKYSPEAA